METELIRPANIRNETWEGLQQLSQSDPARAREIAAAASRSANPDAYVATALPRFRTLTAAGSGLNAARFGSAPTVLPFAVPPAANKAMVATAGLQSTTDDAALSARYGIIEGITAAIS
ncbi:MAG TPA: hypothetical protein VFX30_10525 [bacterium]|nr:hypothetical protein [bacterium]